MTNIHHLSICTILTAVLSPPSMVLGQVDDYQPKQVLRNPIRAITNPPIAAVDDAEIDGDELVIGVEVNGEARAYPINQLTGPRREIINDKLGGQAIAATW